MWKIGLLSSALLVARIAEAAKSNGGSNTTAGSSYGGCPLSNLVDKEKFVGLHNVARQSSKAGAVEWDDDLASFAQCWANRCNFEHSHTANYGENIACGSGEQYDLTQSVDDWWQEFKDWQPGMGFAEATGHFTQMAWKDTNKVGCGVARCPSHELGLGGTYSDAIFVVCEYHPAGNVIGHFERQVSLPNRNVNLKALSTNVIKDFATNVASAPADSSTKEPQYAQEPQHHAQADQYGGDSGGKHQKAESENYGGGSNDKYNKGDDDGNWSQNGVSDNFEYGGKKHPSDNENDQWQGVWDWWNNFTKSMGIGRKRSIAISRPSQNRVTARAMSAQKVQARSQTPVHESLDTNSALVRRGRTSSRRTTHRRHVDTLASSMA